MWTNNEELCFQRLKKLLWEAPVLVFLKGEGEIVISTDASKEAVGGVLLQNNHLDAYASASLTPP